MQIEVRCLWWRYINHLDPGVNKEGWSDEELEILYSKYGEYGNKWFLLQKHLPGRYISNNSGPRQRSRIISTVGSVSSWSSSSRSYSGKIRGLSVTSKLRPCWIFIKQITVNLKIFKSSRITLSSRRPSRGSNTRSKRRPVRNTSKIIEKILKASLGSSWKIIPIRGKEYW